MSKLKSAGPQVRQSTPDLASLRAFVTAARVSICRHRTPCSFHHWAYSSRPSRPLTPCRATPTTVSHLGVIKGVQGFLHHRFILHQGDLDSHGSQVQDVSDEIGVAGVLDAELNRHPQVLGGGTEGDQLLLVGRGCAGCLGSGNCRCLCSVYLPSGTCRNPEAPTPPPPLLQRGCAALGNRCLANRTSLFLA